MKKIVLAGLAAVVLATGGWYFASPALAMQGLRDAALAGDREELKERVDFPGLRDSLKSQMRARMAAEMAKEKDNPFGPLGMAFASALLDPLVDAVVSPEGIKGIVESGKVRGPEQQAAAAATKAEEVEWQIDRRGLNLFIAQPVATSGEEGPSLVFRRDGLGWDLVDVEVSFPANSAAGEGA